MRKKNRTDHDPWRSNRLYLNYSKGLVDPPSFPTMASLGLGHVLYVRDRPRTGTNDGGTPRK